MYLGDRGAASQCRCFLFLFRPTPRLTVLTLLVVPVSLVRNILQPCWQCFDFEAAAVHEIGHILGLSLR